MISFRDLVFSQDSFLQQNQLFASPTQTQTEIEADESLPRPVATLARSTVKPRRLQIESDESENEDADLIRTRIRQRNYVSDKSIPR